MLTGQARALLDKAMEDAETQRAPGRAITRPQLRPYLPDRRAATALMAGSGVLCRCIGRGVLRAWRLTWAEAMSGENRADRAESAGIALLAMVVTAVPTILAGRALLHLAAPYALWIWWSAAAGWTVAALAVAPPRQAPEHPATIMKDDTPGEQPAQPPLDAATVTALVRQIATANRWQGAHLDDLLAHLPGRSRTELLAVLAAAGIPVADQLKLRLPGGGQRNRQGVRLSALPEGPEKAPPAPATTPAEPAPEHPARPLPDRPPVTVHGGG
ncbi:hypothetical protein [Actinacidiphila sp. ITFR-21]|uniref:hypothetical protein n=1 Tax=Actinacidiphila sp. ITFR-21 TaxID=3075199 RepID=UPI00288A8804|nr:hypothetical protein [Streptomyces sp. ITFR-21]WNI19191.1 hypothetical protein RLT57_29050 [Streptomyces sp. ITFR-21]